MTPTSRITDAFARARDEQRATLVLYIMAGDPDLETTGALLTALSAMNVDVIELGLPFSDPVADGPVIQAAGQRALKNEITVSKILDFVGDMKNGISTPLVGMGYTNPIFTLGYEAFVRKAKDRGLDGIIVPDLPVEEGGELLHACRHCGLDWIQLVAPTTRPERVRFLAEQSMGFVYYVSRLGITGARSDVSQTLTAEVEQVRRASPLPVAVGFGLSTPQQAAAVSQCADGVVIGSAVVRIIAEAPDRGACVERVRAFVASIQSALRHPAQPTAQQAAGQG